MTEARLQNKVAKFLDRELPDDAVWAHVPNGGKRRPREAAQFKNQGVKAGFPDNIIVYRGRPIFIELKTPDGSLSPEQVDFHGRLKLAGALVVVCTSEQEVAEFLNAALGINATTNKLSPAW